MVPLDREENPTPSPKEGPRGERTGDERTGDERMGNRSQTRFC